MLKYFIEIKNRMILVLLAWTAISIVAYSYKESLLFLMTKPCYAILLKQTPSGTPYFIFTDITEIFSVYIKVTFFCSFQIGGLALIYHSLLFFIPSLFNLEEFYLKKLLTVFLLVWLISILGANYVLIPITWDFFLSFQEISTFKSVSLHFEAKLSEYTAFYITLFYVCIFYSQFLVVLLLFLHYNNKTVSSIQKFRKIYYYIFIIIATAITPPDVVSQLIASSLVIIIYEICLFLLIVHQEFNLVTS